MGNRAVVKFKNDGEKHGVYLHWNGGPESILAFLQTMQDRKWTRMDYASARFVAVVGEFFDSSGDDSSGLSLGIVDDSEGWASGADNGLYEVDHDGERFKVVQRGKPISIKELSDDDQEQYLGIVAELKRTRKARMPK